jgi:regulator of protease activity HflC (stomatin/prohibitin superfamily)
MEEVVNNETEPIAVGYTQLSQVRVPLDEADEAFSMRDASGQIPIVVVPQRLNRVRNELVIGGVLILLGGIVLTFLQANALYLSVAVPVALILIGLGIYRSFIVRIPEGANGLLTRGGRYIKTQGSGNSFLPPWIAVSHLVTRREIPFDVPIIEAPTQDNVRVRVDTLITFTITEPYKFVYSISANDFDQVFQATCQDALRTKMRQITSGQVIDMVRKDLDELQQTLNEDAATYGVTVSKVTVTFAQPPAEFMASLEARQLATVQQAEQAEQQALALRRQIDTETLLRQEVIARVERQREQLKLLAQEADARRKVVELEAEAESLRLAKLEERLKAFPLAAQYEWESTQLEVARSLAGNPRAVVQVGNVGDITRALVLGDLMRFAVPAAAATENGSESEQGSTNAAEQAVAGQAVDEQTVAEQAIKET